MRLFHNALLCLFATSSLAMGAPRVTIERDSKDHFWFKTPDGTRLFSVGINNISSKPFMPRPKTQYYEPVSTIFGGKWDAWSTSVRQIMNDAHVNTVGGWSDPAVATSKGIWRTPVLYTTGAEGERCLDSLRPGFEAKVEKNVREALAKYPDRSDILGVFLDNEMPWFGANGWDNTPNYTLLEKAFTLPVTDPARVAALDALKARHKTIEAFNAAWKLEVKSWDAISADVLRTSSTDAAAEDRTRYTSAAAERFYEVSAAEVRKQAPELLILGTRFAGDAPTCVIAACGRVCDVVSLNYYSGPKVPARVLAQFYVLTQKPLMLTEFAWRAKDNQSGCPNTQGAGAVVLTQAERAAHYTEFVEDLASYPMVIGAHWFEWADQSPQGRFDGEDSNYGVVDLKHNKYEALLKAMTNTNAKVASLHEGTTKEIPSVVPAPEGVTLKSGQHPERPPQVEMLGNWMHEPEIWGAADSKLTYAKTDSTVKLTFTTGQSYGAGISLYMPQANHAKGATEPVGDVDGYNEVVLEADAPAGLEMNFVLAEANCVKSGSSTLDDGESFLSESFVAKSGRQTYKVPLAKFKHNAFHGNQGGTKGIDMASVGNIGLQLHGNPQSGVVTVYSFRLEK